MCTVMIEASIL